MWLLLLQESDLMEAKVNIPLSLNENQRKRADEFQVVIRRGAKIIPVMEYAGDNATVITFGIQNPLNSNRLICSTPQSHRIYSK